MDISHNLSINHYIVHIMIEHDVLNIVINILHKKVIFFCTIIIECVGFKSHLTSKYSSIPISASITALCILGISYIMYEVSTKKYIGHRWSGILMSICKVYSSIVRKQFNLETYFSFFIK